MDTPKRSTRDERVRLPLGLAVIAATGAFGVVLALDRVFHPVFFLRHHDRMLEECGIAAVIVFAATVIVGTVRKPWQ